MRATQACPKRRRRSCSLSSEQRAHALPDPLIPIPAPCILPTSQPPPRSPSPTLLLPACGVLTSAAQLPRILELTAAHRRQPRSTLAARAPHTRPNTWYTRLPLPCNPQQLPTFQAPRPRWHRPLTSSNQTTNFTRTLSIALPLLPACQSPGCWATRCNPNRSRWLSAQITTNRRKCSSCLALCMCLPISGGRGSGGARKLSRRLPGAACCGRGQNRWYRMCRLVKFCAHKALGRVPALLRWG